MTELNDADLPPVTAALLGKHFAKFPEHLTVTRWKDGIDISDPIFEIKALCRDYARQAIKDYPAKQEVVRYEYRHLDDSGNTVTPGWSEWRPVVPRNAYTDTVLDKVREFEAYIAQGYKLEVRSLIVKEDL